MSLEENTSSVLTDISKSLDDVSKQVDDGVQNMGKSMGVVITFTCPYCDKDMRARSSDVVRCVSCMKAIKSPGIIEYEKHVFARDASAALNIFKIKTKALAKYPKGKPYFPTEAYQPPVPATKQNADPSLL
eukprot:TRINITY_DN4131_c0_g1_i1.p1 TRINITY_DN4131_c0_g1~~TRINITY_DN4131_c0_g1_i1.p1  ORF type:complete len:131 (+),score=23.45 TRINITY_DN4131_c0_g1_i1:104-496(+)